MVRKRARGVDQFISSSEMTSAPGLILEAADETAAYMLDPHKCEPWDLHNRSLLWFDNEATDNLKSTIESLGQQQPGLVRRSTMVDRQYDIIFGVRRWHCCKELGIDFQARILPDDASDVLCAQLMEVENAQSEDITELEKALAYQAQLKAGLYKSQKDLALSYEISKQYVNKLVRAAKPFDIPWLKEAFDPVLLDVSVKKAGLLSGLIVKPGNAEKMEAAYKTIDPNKRHSADKLLRLLINACEAKLEPQMPVVLLKQGGKIAVSSKIDKEGNIQLSINPTLIKEEDINDVMPQIADHVTNVLAQYLK